MAQHGATLNGEIDPKGFESTVFFNYGIDTNLDNVAFIEGVFTEPSVVSADIIDLLPETTYSFQIGLEYVNGTILGDVLSFTTLADPIVPTVQTLDATNIS